MSRLGPWLLVVLAAGPACRKPPETAAWLERHAPGEPALGPAPTSAARNPIRRQAERLILNPGNEEVSVWWLQARGIAHLVSRDHVKFDALLEAEHTDGAGYRIYKTPLRRPSPAILVSRHQWKSLPPFRSQRDRVALAAYVAWADLAEAAGWRPTGPATAEVRVDLGPDDMILIRQDIHPGWSASLDGQPLPCLRDPIGFVLLDPRREGPSTISVSFDRSFWAFWSERGRPNRPPDALPERDPPAIHPGGVLDGLRHTPPPFAPGTVITLYGSDLEENGKARVLVAGRPVQTLYAGDTQVNVQLPADLPPGTVEIVVERDGSRSDAVRVEIRAP